MAPVIKGVKLAGQSAGAKLVPHQHAARERRFNFPPAWYMTFPMHSGSLKSRPSTPEISGQYTLANRARRCLPFRGKGILFLLLAGLVASLQAAPPLVDVWRAMDLNTLDDGGAVGSWASASNRVATGAIGLQPIFKTEVTPAGGPVVRFTNSLLTVPDSPVGGSTAFSLALVFRANKVGANDGTQWYGKTGIVDAEASGTQPDWGVVIDQSGHVGMGTGDPDVSTYSTGASLIGTTFHTALFTWGNSTQAVYVDTRAPVVQANVSTTPRMNAGFALGGIFTGEGESRRRLVGDLVEIRFYDGALSTDEASNVIAELRSLHISNTGPRIITFAATTNWLYLGASALLSWEVTNADQVIIDQGIGPVPARGSRLVTPFETQSYTLTAITAAGSRSKASPSRSIQACPSRPTTSSARPTTPRWPSPSKAPIRKAPTSLMRSPRRRNTGP